jgi:hypothetical protein
MKLIRGLIAFIPFASTAQSFTDLTLDNPNLTGLMPFGNAGAYQGPVSQLLPGWNVTLNGSPLSIMYYAPLGVGYGGPYAILTENASSVDPADLGPFSLRLTTFVPPPPFGGAGVDVRMAQTGQIPANATGLKLYSNANVDVFVDGKRIGGIDPQQNGFPTLNISAYSGRIVDLEFRFPLQGDFNFDIRGFTTAPEPSTWAFFALGTSALCWQVWRRRKV